MGTIGSLGEKVVCDRQGRFTLTPKLMAHAGITNKALLIGAITTIQIWEPAIWEERKMSNEASLDVIEALQEQPTDNFTEILKNAVQR
jgi:DNA-binding transcriptional regulator/RsmH inhibitor MraZ